MAKIIDIRALFNRANNPKPGNLLPPGFGTKWYMHGRIMVQVYTGRGKWEDAYSDTVDRGTDFDTYWEVYYTDGSFDLISKSHVRVI